MFIPTDNSPEQQAIQGAKEGGVFRSVAKTALSMVAYGFGMKVFRGLSFRANQGIGQFVSKLVKPNTSLGKSLVSATRRVEMAAGKSMTKDAARGAVSFVNRLKSSIRTSVESINTSLRRSVGPGIKEGYYNPKLIDKAINRGNRSMRRGVPRSATSSYFTKNSELKDLRLTTIIGNTKAFKDSTFGRNIRQLGRDAAYSRKHSNVGVWSAMVGKNTGVDNARILRGRAFRYGTYLGSVAAFDYAISNITRPSDKKWYNPKKVAEWAAFTVTSDLAFRGAIPNAKRIASGTAGLISRAMKGLGIGNRIAHSLLSKGERIAYSTNAHAFGRALDRSTMYDKSSNPFTEAAQRMNAFAREFGATKQRINESIQKMGGNKKKSIIGTKDAIDEALDFQEQVTKNMSESKARLVQRDITKSLEKATDATDPNKWAQSFNRIFGTNIESQKRLISGDPTNAEYFRGHGYVSLDGKNYDVSNIMPKKLLSKAFGFANDNFTLLGFKPLSILGLKPLLEAQSNKYALYTNQNTPNLVHIGIGSDHRAIKNRLNYINTEKQKIQLSVLSRESQAKPGMAQEELNKLMDDFSSGKLSRHSAKDRELFNNLEREASDLENNKKFVEDFYQSRKVGNKNRLHNDMALLKRGYVNLRDEEYVLFAGDKMWYGARDGKNYKSYQIGYDANKAAYHQFTHLSKENAGGMVNLLANYTGMSDFDEVDATGRIIRNTGSQSRASTHRIVNPNAGPFTKMKASIFDVLEVQNKPQRSIFESMGNYVTKLFNPKSIRNIQHYSADLAEGWVDTLHNNEELKAFVGRWQTVMRNTNITMTDKLVRKSGFINAIQAHAGRTGTNIPSLDKDVQSVFESVKDGSIFAKVDPSISDTAFNSNIKASAQKLINARNAITKMGSDGMAQNTSSKDIAFLHRILEHDDPIGFLHSTYPGRGRNLDAYNNLAFRTYYKSLETAKQTDLVDYLQSLPSLKGVKRDIETLSMIPMIDTYSNVNVGQLDEATLKLLGSNTIKEINKNPGAINRMIATQEQWWKTSNIHDNVSYPNPTYQAANITLSKNVDMAGTRSIYSFGEQLTASSRDAFGNRHQNVLTVNQMLQMQALNAVNNTGQLLGIGFNPDATRSAADFGKRLIFKRVLPAIAIAKAYRAADAFFDESGAFEGTALGEGLTPLAANMIGQTRLAIAGINDKMGVTATAKYLEDVMPGFVNSPLAHTVRGIGGPLAGMGMGMKFGGPYGALVGGSIGAAMSIMSSGGPLGMIGKFDITKSRADLIEEYSGRRETPVYKGSGWLLGGGSVKGTKVERFEPSWYQQMTSQYRYTSNLYGSKMERLLSPFDMDHYFEKHRMSRPYPVTENILSHTPIVGNVLGFGGQMANEEEMKYTAYASAINGGNGVNLSGFDFDNINGIGGMSMGGAAGTPNSQTIFSPRYDTKYGIGGGYQGPPAVMPNSFGGRFQAAYSQATDLLGLRGFATESIINQLNGGMMPYEDIPKLESASYMTSPFRHYWDANLGDMFGTNELIRRFIPKHGQHVNEVNPLMNTMPSWIANSNSLVDLSTGDPYTSIKKGELRLPGSGYEATHGVRFRFPLEAEYIGKSYEEQVGELTGNRFPSSPDEKWDRALRGPIATSIGEQLSTTNADVKINRTVFDVQSNMSGKLDVVVGGRGMQVRPVSHETFSSIGNEPLKQHQAELNAVLNMGGMKQGSVIYFDVETGETKTTDMYANTSQYYQDLSQLLTAKGAATDLFNKYGPAVGFNMANAYSRLDRLRILADVSPFSKEYEDTLGQVRRQKAAGLLSEFEQVRLNDTIRQRQMVMERYTTSDYKFNRGTAVTDDERQYQQYVSSNYNAVERTMGSIWESFSHMKTPIHTKFLDMKSPLERYEQMEVYGKPIRDWGSPYQAFIRPYATSMASKRTIGEGALSFGMGGFIFGGPVGGAVGAVAGAAYGGINPGWGQVPGYRQREREITGQIDNVRYQKAKMAYDATGSIQAKQEMERTLTHQYNTATNFWSMTSAVPKHERAFMQSFINTGTAEERARIKELLPEYAMPIVEKAWAGERFTPNPDDNIMSTYDSPSPEWKGYNANISTDDIAVKMLDRAGLDAKEVGLGWNSQIRKMRYTPGIPESFSEVNKGQENIAPAIESIVKSIVPGANVSVLPTSLPGISVTVV